MITSTQKGHTSGSIACVPVLDNERGQSYVTKGGAMGIYVGTSLTGLEWYAYCPEDFVTQCADFDYAHRGLTTRRRNGQFIAPSKR